jgi:hypothetical protein
MRKLLAFIYVIIIMGCFQSISVVACTAFSVHSTNTFYGKNWDFDLSRKSDVVITLDDLGNNLSSLKFMLKNSGFLCSAINSAGFFVTCNANSGVKAVSNPKYNSNIVDIATLREKSVNFTKISDVKNYIANKNVTCYGYAEHVFFADKYGDSCVVETDNEKTHIIDDQNNFLVATNFPLYSLDSLDDLSMVPCNRYISAYKSIKNNFQTFDLSKGIETLKGAVQPSYTIYSFIYDAKDNLVYLFLDQDFDKIWKISFKTKSITTFKGFDKNIELKLDSHGVLFTDLESFQETGVFTDNNSISNRPIVDNDISPVTSVPLKNGDYETITIIAFLVFIILVAIIIYRVKKQKITDDNL